MYRKTYIEIDSRKLKENILNIKSKYPEYEYYMGVVKGNAYGFGYNIIDTLIQNGINYLIVSSLDEALEIRKINSFIPILCLEPIDIKYIEICLKHDISISISSYQYFEKINNIELSKQLKVHLKVDTGLNRLGLTNSSEIEKIIEICEKKENIFIEGIYSHFATSGINDDYWFYQLRNFEKLIENIDITKIPIIHLGSSVSLVTKKKIPFCNAIRLGIIMYGLMPNYLFNPIFSLYSHIVEIKDLEKNQRIGYGNNFYMTNKKTKIGIIPLGYSDGFSKANDKLDVFIKNKKYKIIKVFMNLTVIEIDNEVKIDDKVTIIDSSNLLSFCKCNNLTYYEVMSSLNNSIERKIV